MKRWHLGELLRRSRAPSSGAAHPLPAHARRLDDLGGVAWMRAAATFLAGVLLAIGAGIAGLVTPLSILEALAVSRTWDPSAALALAAAAATYAVPARIILSRGPIVLPERSSPWTEEREALRSATGAILLGIGLGTAGYVPAAAIAGLGAGSWPAGLFASAMVAGVVLFELAFSRDPASIRCAPAPGEPAPGAVPQPRSRSRR